MNKQSHSIFLKQYNSYKEILDVPTVFASFYQKDFHAMEYCSQIDFVALIIPFGKNLSNEKYDCVFLKNDLVTYTEMYSELYGSSTISKMSFFDSAMEISKSYLNKNDLSFEELYPIAFIENNFLYNAKKHKHKGLIFVGRLSDNQVFNSHELSIRNINDEFLFSNPHNKVIFDIVREHIERFMVDDDLEKERIIAAKLLSSKSKEAKVKFLLENNIDTSNISILKNKIINDIAMKAPKKIIDIACGDDEIIYDIAKNAKAQLFANDIALPYITKFHKNKKDYSRIIFTNFNAIDAPFKQNAFDVLLCKNLLHHVRENLRIELISHLLDISKEVLLVEILHVDEQNHYGCKLHNDFYNCILNETNGKYYMCYREIENLCRTCNAEIGQQSLIETNNGKYAYMWIRKNK